MRALAAFLLSVVVACSSGVDSEAPAKDAGSAEAGLDAGKPDASDAAGTGDATRPPSKPKRPSKPG